MIKKVILGSLFGGCCACVGAIVFAGMELVLGRKLLQDMVDGKIEAKDLDKVQTACVIIAMKDEVWNSTWNEIFE